MRYLFDIKIVPYRGEWPYIIIATQLIAEICFVVLTLVVSSVLYPSDHLSIYAFIITYAICRVLTRITIVETRLN